VACVPAYNEEKTIAEVIAKTIPHVDELIVVDDGSRDSTGLIAERLGAVVIRHARNLGKGVAVRHCMDVAGKKDSDIIVTLDADGQHDPDEIPSLIRPVQTAQADIVIGSRIMSGQNAQDMGVITLASNRVVSYLLSAKFGGDFTDVQTGYRAYSGEAAKRILRHLRSTRFEIELEIICTAKLLGLILKEVPVTIHKRAGGVTKFTFLLRMRSLYFAFKYILSTKRSY
jgi:glycosyltransferase involved in cell wall biosynthesis